MHIDDFIDDYRQDAYARWMFMHFQLPVNQAADFRPFIEKHRLFCTYEGQRYRVTGASRMGDVWARQEFQPGLGLRPSGRCVRVLRMECPKWVIA